MKVSVNMDALWQVPTDAQLAFERFLQKHCVPANESAKRTAAMSVHRAARQASAGKPEPCVLCGRPPAPPSKSRKSEPPPGSDEGAGTARARRPPKGE